LKCYTNKSPLASFILTDTVQNEEEFVGALNNGSSEYIEFSGSRTRISGGGRWWSCVHNEKGQDPVTQKELAPLLLRQPGKQNDLVF
jgi:hypothetical protein